MVYESDFYTTRRPYSRPTPSITSYTVTRREVPWDKVPCVPRPSQVEPAFTVFGTSGQAPGEHREVCRRTHRRLLFTTPYRAYTWEGYPSHD